MALGVGVGELNSFQDLCSTVKKAKITENAVWKTNHWYIFLPRNTTLKIFVLTFEKFWTKSSKQERCVLSNSALLICCLGLCPIQTRPVLNRFQNSSEFKIQEKGIKKCS